MDASTARIRTPDQRIRVFVSSTLRELEPERAAVRAAVERLQLAPVMFELGARPHPPRDLYRSYLAQSDIFVGIYWEKYGWVAPEEEVSGLEDEYLMSGSLPSLIYIKEPAPEREARLDDLLGRIRGDDRSSYKSFRTPEELAELLTGDLAILLAERFEASRLPTAHAHTPAPAQTSTAGIPAPYTSLVGRVDERRELIELLARPQNRIVTIVGPGGIGKSRLAIELARDQAERGREVAFALLEAVPRADRVILMLARALGVRDAAGEGSLEDRVIAAVGDRDVLLVVDNMEHVLDAATTLVHLINGCPRLQLLITSRSPLRVRAERVYELGPLDLPEISNGAESKTQDMTDAAAAASAVSLFVARAVAVNPGFRLTPANTADVVAICRTLDGVPLAIELAAARVRSLSPAEILARLDSALTLLVSGARDLPERQRALRSTIEWSVDLLPESARSALSTLSVFAGTFALSSAESVLAAVGADDPLGDLDALVDASLIGRTDTAAGAAFRMLSVVRTYARGVLDLAALERATLAWIAHYRASAREAAAGLRGPDQLDWLARIDQETEDYARVARVLLERREIDHAADYMWSLYLFFWIGGALGVVEGWATEMLGMIERADAAASVHSRAVALYYRNAVLFWQDPSVDTAPGMDECRRLFRDSGDGFGAGLAGISLGLSLLVRREGPDIPGAVAASQEGIASFRAIGDAWGEAMSLVVIGRIDIMTGDMDAALAHFEESYRLAERAGERLGVVIALNHRGWARFLRGDLEGARDDFATSLDMSLSMGHDEGIAYGFEAFAAVRASEGDARTAGCLVGAARRLRVRRGMFNPSAFEFYMISLGALREAGLGPEVDAGIADGEQLSVAEAMAHVRA